MDFYHGKARAYWQRKHRFQVWLNFIYNYQILINFLIYNYLELLHVGGFGLSALFYLLFLGAIHILRHPHYGLKL